MALSSKIKGRLIMLLGVVAVTPDSLCVRFLESTGASNWCILFWTQVCVGTMLGSIAVTRSGGFQPVWTSTKPVCRLLPFALVFQGIVYAGFTISLFYTSAANTLLFISMNPVWAAIFGFLVLGERVPCRTLLALVMSIASMLIIFLPATIGVGHEEKTEHKRHEMLLGNCLALLTGISLAASITMVRYAGKAAPEGNMIVVPALGVCLPLLLCIVAGGHGILPSGVEPLWQFWCVVVLDAACKTSLFLALSIAPALISGPETGLIILLEVILGPLWVGLAYRSIPSMWTFIGGGILLCSLVLHELLASKALDRDNCAGQEDCDKVENEV